ncbi:MAG: CHAT domain-containing protein, partial [Bacteroidota bacterium]
HLLDSIRVGRVYGRLARIEIESGKYDIASRHLSSAKKYLVSIENCSHPEWAFWSDYKGWLLKNLSDYEEATQHLKNAIDIRVKTLGDKHLKLGESYINLGTTYLKKGTYAEAETFLLSAKKVFESHNKKTGLLGYTLQELGNNSYLMGNYSTALSYLQQSKAILSTTTKLRLFTGTMSLLAIVYERLGEIEEAEKIYQDAIKKWVHKNGKQNVRYANLSVNLGELYDYNGQPQKALATYLEAKKVYEAAKKTLNPNYAAILNNLGYLYENQGEWDKAKQSYLQMVKIDSTVLGTTHPDYLYSLYNIAKLYRKLNNPAKTAYYFKKANQGQLELIHNYYSTFDEATRINYLEDIQPGFNELYSYLRDTPNKSVDLLNDAQQISLSTKGLALDYNKVNQDKLQEFGNKDLRKAHKEWSNKRKALTTAYSLSESERSANQIDLTQLKQQTELKEKAFVRLAEYEGVFVQKRGSVEVKELAVKLKKNEVTIDFIKYQYYATTSETTDTFYYQALLTTKDNPTPRFISLCTEKQLQKVLRLSSQYGAGYTKYPEIGQKLYELIWQPLEPYLADVKTVHLSPTGLLHKVAFGGLPYNDGHLIDQYRLHYYGNLRDFINARPAAIPPSIALMGGAYFDVDSVDRSQLAPAAAELAFAKLDTFNSSESIASVSRAIASDSTRNAIAFNYLPGTLMEVEQLTTAFTVQDWQTTTYTGVQASEDNLKILSGEKAPGILHLATHGFFFDPYNQATELSDETLRERIIGAESPLLRSGLVLAGANYSWKGGKAIKGIEDGVLTAYEIANMELDRTELVVLSACETGLGDVNSAEGVFGLQRAFKAAGVNRLLISLWKIPDAQTAELMQLFYDYFLSGMTLSEALRTAQQTMSQSYGPYYWAGFVLLE